MNKADKYSKKNDYLTIVSFNVNGFHRLIKDENNEFYKIRRLNPDFICLQETWCADFKIPGLRDTYKYYSNPCKTTPGRNGVSIVTNKEPIKVIYGFGETDPEMDGEGRLITLEYEAFYLLCCYFPSAVDNVKKVHKREKWDQNFYKFVSDLLYEKDVIMGGDFNTILNKEDAYNGESGFGKDSYRKSEQERAKEMLNLGFSDALKVQQNKAPNENIFSYFSNQDKNRTKGNGRRLDYFFVSSRLSRKVRKVDYRKDIFGSDHCPVVLKLKLSIDGATCSCLKRAGTTEKVKSFYSELAA